MIQRDVERPMGCLISSENSLNQHIKIKHRDFWVSKKNREMNMHKAETIYFKQDKHFLENSVEDNKNNEIDFKKSENKFI